MHSDLQQYLAQAQWPEARRRRMVDGLRLLQSIAIQGTAPITYAEFAEAVQPKLAPLASAAILEDIGVFCNRADWPNVTCFVVSATTGDCSDGSTKISGENPEKARDSAWFRYKVYKNAPLADGP